MSCPLHLHAPARLVVPTTHLLRDAFHEQCLHRQTKVSRRLQCLATGTSGSALPWPPLRPRTHRAFHGPTGQPTIERPKLLRRPAPLPGSAAQRLLLTVRSSSHISRGLADLIGRDSCVSNYHRHPRHPASSSSGPAVFLFTAGGSRHLVSASLSSRAFQPFWGIVPVRAPRGTNASHVFFSHPRALPADKSRHCAWLSSLAAKGPDSRL